MKILEILAAGELTALDKLPKGDTTSTGLTNIINWVLAAGGIIAVGVIVYGAIKFLTSQGQPDKTKQASQIIAYAIIGLVIVALAFAIVNFVFGAIGEATK